jgi:hypothetical protein
VRAISNSSVTELRKIESDSCQKLEDVKLRSRAIEGSGVEIGGAFTEFARNPTRRLKLAMHSRDGEAVTRVSGWSPKGAAHESLAGSLSNSDRCYIVTSSNTFVPLPSRESHR